MIVMKTKIRCASLLERVDDYPGAGFAVAMFGSSRPDGVIQSPFGSTFTHVHCIFKLI